VVGLLAQAATVLAEPAAQASAHEQSAAAFDEGRQLLERGQPAEACARFAQAIELEPGNVGVMLNLGLCNEQLDRFATALTWFRTARARASERELAESTRAASDQIAALSGQVPAVRIALSPPSAAATVIVDGATVPASQLGRVELDAGHHVVELAVAGVTAVRKELDVVDGAEVPVELVVPRAPPTAVDRPGDAGSRRRVYIAGAIGGGLVLGSVALGLAGRSAVRSTDHPDVQRDWRLAVRYGGTSMFVAGGAALGWAIWTWFHAPGERADRTAIAPVVGDHSVGLGARGAF
jgi:hypothetical protein